MDPVKKNKTKSKILLARKKRLRRRRDLLRLVRDIRRFPVVPLIFRRICQLQYLRAYSYKINRIKWVSWPVELDEQYLDLFEGAVAERRHATMNADRLFMGLNPVPLATIARFLFLPKLRRIPYSKFALRYCIRALRDLAKNKSLLFSDLRGKSVFLLHNKKFAMNFFFWHKRRRRCRVFVALGNCLGFRRAGLLLLSQQFRLGMPFVNYLTLDRRNIIFITLLNRFRVGLLRCFFRKIFYPKAKKSKLNGLSVVKKKMRSRTKTNVGQIWNSFRKLSSFFRLRILYSFKVQHGLIRSKLHYYKLLRESDLLAVFNSNLSRRFANVFSAFNLVAHNEQLVLICDMLKSLSEQNQKKIFSNKIRVFRKNNLIFLLCRRLIKLLTKRGGRLRAYKNLQNTLYALKPTRRQVSLFRESSFRVGGKKAKIKSPILLALKKLRTYFFLRKFTKSRKTIFIPGILPKRRRIRVIARWLAAAASRGSERTLQDRLFGAITQASKGQGPAKHMQLAFNKSVKVNKVNLRANNRRRRWFLRRAPWTMKNLKEVFVTLNQMGRDLKLRRHLKLRQLRTRWSRKKKWGKKFMSKEKYRRWVKWTNKKLKQTIKAMSSKPKKKVPAK